MGQYDWRLVPTGDGCSLLPVLVGSGKWLLRISNGRKLIFPQKLVEGDLTLVHGVLVEIEHTPPLELAGDRPVLPPAPALDVQILTSAVAGRIRGLLLVLIGDEHVL